MTGLELCLDVQKRLASGGIESFSFEAKQLVHTVCDNVFNSLSDAQVELVLNKTERRLKGEPLQYILGFWEFFGFEFLVGDGVLIPRSDTETIIDVCLEKFSNVQNLKIMDLCSGSGCIAITLAKLLQNSKVLAVEKFDKAYEWLTKNNQKHGQIIDIVKADVFEFAPTEKFDLIVSNPPYIRQDVIPSLQKEVGFEPITALDGGNDGLLFYQHIAKFYKNHLTNGGLLMFEIGFDQGETVSEILQQNGYENIEIVCDLSDNQRVVYGTSSNI